MPRILPKPPNSHAPPQDAREATAQYIGQMTAELAELAESAQLDLLTYFLRMAQLEAEALLRGED